MTKKLNRVLLIDDNPNDNFIHERAIKKTGKATEIVTIESAVEALQYLKSHNVGEQLQPDLIFLDINMPGMNGWEFLEEYKKLSDHQRAKVIVTMLTTSGNPADRERARQIDGVAHYLIKPLTAELFTGLLETYFPEVMEE